MKKTIMAIAILLAAAASGFAQVKMDTTQKSHSHTVSKATKYTCTMHPEVVRSKPGKCPKCGMALVPVKKLKTAKKEKAMSDMKM
ncbi:heavy metal-binding domain-containing protein [Ferruginibacter sp.]|nr:hypothetical protein [Ferruginibacter sp.]